jgi:hypothetical protein
LERRPKIPNPQWESDYEKKRAFFPTGKVWLQIQSHYCYKTSIRARFAEGPRACAEDLIPEFIASLLKAAALVRREQEESKRADEERLRKEQEWLRVQREVEKEEERVKVLLKDSESWEKAERLRRYVKHAEQTKAWSEERIEWAKQQADRLDPLVRDKPPSIIDQKG